MAATAQASREAEEVLDELIESGPHPDPYPLYDRIREIGKVVYSEKHQRWFVTGFDEVAELHLKHPALGQGEEPAPVHDPRYRDSSYLRFLPRMTPWIDPPRHTRLRRLFAPAFTPRRINSMEGSIRDRVNSLFDAAERKEQPDLVVDVAEQVPISTISDLLGLPEEIKGIGLEWAQEMADLILVPLGVLTEEQLARGNKVIDESSAYFEAVIAEREANPGDDLLSAFVQAEEGGDRLTAEEMVAISFQLFIAASETSVGTMSLGALWLLRNPEQLQKLREDQDLDMLAAEEFLRYDAPVQMNMPRIALEDCEVGGVKIARGEIVTPVNGAANRDVTYYDDAHRFDISRDAPHLTFGRGIHFCIGAPLARLQVAIAVSTLVRRYPGLEQAGEAELRGSAGLRALSHLPVKLA